jgi:hypothetical protein
MRPDLRAILAIVSLLLCLAAIAGWVRSHLAESVLFASLQGSFAIASVNTSQGMLEAILGSSPDDQLVRELASHATEVHGRFGFGYAKGAYRGMRFSIVRIPYWLIVGLTAILPIRWWLDRRRRAGRRRSGRCVECGYDLRRTTGHRCPECGRELPAARVGPNG